ncbi:MAG: thiol:disulfide interchange protein DsbA/DsbL [Sulfuritalea sp.]|jgi:thiol:disulfide interchange protein DsbA|nr:thiol:disulfide interchange protein DsbA/DsbL [Sulfuritalea sp.]
MKQLVNLLFATLMSAFVLPAVAFAAEPQVGKEFKMISPALASPKDKIEVVEFFSYGCNHCSDFHPIISQWAAKLPKDVSFRRIPVSFNRPEWARLSKTYYALEATGDLAKLDAAVFIAIHEQRVPFKSDEAVIAWVGSKGADAKKFGEAFSGFSMQAKVQRADQDASAARIGGVPSLAVDGRYLINNEAASSYEDLLRITDSVVAKVRQERKGK